MESIIGSGKKSEESYGFVGGCSVLVITGVLKFLFLSRAAGPVAWVSRVVVLEECWQWE
jgi:hypothetical protein